MYFFSSFKGNFGVNVTLYAYAFFFAKGAKVQNYVYFRRKKSSQGLSIKAFV